MNLCAGVKRCEARFSSTLRAFATKGLIDMRRVPAPLEIIGYAVLSIAGLILLYEGTTDQSGGLLVAGAFCITLGLLTLVYAIRNTLWHRRMQRQSATVGKLDLG